MILLLSFGWGCGRSLLYRYPPPPPGSDDGGLLADGGRRRLPDGGLLDGGAVDPPGLTCVPTLTESYTLPLTRRPIDVLFIVDDSRSMKDNQDALAANFMAFITSFTSKQVDFHLGTVTTDMVKATRSGRLVTPFLTPLTPNLADAFAKMVKVGIAGSGNEQGIAAAHAALSAPLLQTANAGFLRAGADLGLVFLSDEDDHSPQSVTSFVSFLKTLKPDPSSMSVAAIVGLESGVTCNTGHWKYTQVAHAFGPRGLVSACDPDYAATLESVSGRLIGTSCIFGLSRALTEDERLRVLLNGAPWLFFRAAADSIYPHGSIELLPCPETGGTVEVIYDDCP